MLCHDDVIGNRRVSYIVYLTGGAGVGGWTGLVGLVGAVGWWAWAFSGGCCRTGSAGSAQEGGIRSCFWACAHDSWRWEPEGACAACPPRPPLVLQTPTAPGRQRTAARWSSTLRAKVQERRRAACRADSQAALCGTPACLPPTNGSASPSCLALPTPPRPLAPRPCCRRHAPPARRGAHRLCAARVEQYGLLQSAARLQLPLHTGGGVGAWVVGVTRVVGAWVVGS